MATETRVSRLRTAARYCLDMLKQPFGGGTLADRIGLSGGYHAEKLLEDALAEWDDGPAEDADRAAALEAAFEAESARAYAIGMVESAIIRSRCGKHDDAMRDMGLALAALEGRSIPPPDRELAMARDLGAFDRAVPVVAEERRDPLRLN